MQAHHKHWISINTQILASEIDCIFVDAFFHFLCCVIGIRIG